MVYSGFQGTNDSLDIFPRCTWIESSRTIDHLFLPLMVSYIHTHRVDTHHHMIHIWEFHNLDIFQISKDHPVDFQELEDPIKAVFIEPVFLNPTVGLYRYDSFICIHHIFPLNLT